MVVGSITSQRRSTVGSSKNGSITAVLGSGIRIMSDSLMPFHPAMEEPSNILPSRNRSSSTSRAGLLLAARVREAQVREFRLFFFYEFQYITGCHIASGKGVELAAGIHWACVRGWRSGLVLQGPCQGRRHSESSS